MSGLSIIPDNPWELTIDTNLPKKGLDAAIQAHFGQEGFSWGCKLSQQAVRDESMCPFTECEFSSESSEGSK